MRVFLIAAAAALVATSASAQSVCGPRENIVEQLDKRYQEQAVAAGVQGQHVIEVWRSPESHSFTILQSRADGVSCLISAGKDLEFFKETAPKTPEEPA